MKLSIRVVDDGVFVYTRIECLYVSESWIAWLNWEWFRLRRYVE